ncbi:MAG: autotransporter outer membrane beta-barrel domain-containing protein [Rhizobiaceae bacterium]
MRRPIITSSLYAITCGLFATTFMTFAEATPAPKLPQFDQVQVAVKPEINIERMRQIRDLVRDLMSQRVRARNIQNLPPENAPFDPSASRADGGQFGLMQEIELLADIIQQNSSVQSQQGTYALQASTTEEAASSTPTTNVFGEVNGGPVESTKTRLGYDGHQLSVNVGLDKSVSERLTLGLIGTHSATDIDENFIAANSTTDAYGIGPYFGLFLTETLVLTGSLLHTWTDNETSNGVVSADYDSRDWMINGTLTSYHFVENWMLAPSIGASYNEERDEAYLDTIGTPYAALTTKTGTFSAGGAATYTHYLENGVILQPKLSFEAEWTFERSVSAGTATSTDEFDVSLAAGLDITFSESAALSLDVTFGGLARSDYESLLAGGRLTLSF